MYPPLFMVSFILPNMYSGVFAGALLLVDAVLTAEDFGLSVFFCSHADRRKIVRTVVMSIISVGLIDFMFTALAPLFI